MTSKEIREKFLDFFKERGHQVVPSSSLIPPDPTVLFTTAGMQQFSLYLAGEKDILRDFGNRHLASCQKCFRTGDIEEIGNDTHHTFFEMLGNWSIGQDEKGNYFKEGAIEYALEFLVGILGLDKNRFWPTFFKGEKNIPKDEESKKIWRDQGISQKRIKEFGMEDNLWGPVGEVGPCGPSSEIFYDRGEKFGCGREDCGPNCPHCKRFVELWTLVFMEYFKDKNGNFQSLPQKNVDTGIGFERLTAILQGKPSAYETDLFLPIIKEIEKNTTKPYTLNAKPYRIIVDHIRGAVFLAAEEIFPSNTERGYVLRRILRRAIRYGKILNGQKNFLIPLSQKVIEIYQNIYPEVKSNQEDILTVIQNEEEKFEMSLEKGLKIFEKIATKGNICGIDAFHLYDTYGFPLELTEELAKERGLTVDKAGFEEALKKHQEISRAGVEKKFGGVGKEATYKSIKLHTATHLLHAALREILGKDLKQMGSDITPQRLRFDFSHPQKITPEEIKKVENLVNQKIREDLEIKKEEMSYEEALRSGALAFFKEKYPEKVTVYSITELPKEAKVKKRTKSSSPKDFSKEICAGPHVNRTGELGYFKIIKEESSGSGVRRIRAILE